MPEEFIEYLIICDTGWTMEYLRERPKNEFYKLSLMSRMKHEIDVINRNLSMKIAAGMPRL